MRDSPTSNMTASMPSAATTWRWAGAEPVNRAYAATAMSRSATAIPTWSILVNALAIVGEYRKQYGNAAFAAANALLASQPP